MEKHILCSLPASSPKDDHERAYLPVRQVDRGHLYAGVRLMPISDVTYSVENSKTRKLLLEHQIDERTIHKLPIPLSYKRRLVDLLTTCACDTANGLAARG
jgi:hypothetical protein